MTRHLSQEERREQILTAARRAFIRDGFSRARMDDVAAEAGLSKGGVYFHFKSKLQIFKALHDEEIARNMELIEALDMIELPVLDKLTALAEQMVLNFAANEEHRRFLIVLAEMGVQHADIHRKIIDSHILYTDAIASQIEKGKARGEVGDVDAYAAAQLFKLLIDGIEQAFALNYPVDVPRLIAMGADVVRTTLRVPLAD